MFGIKQGRAYALPSMVARGHGRAHASECIAHAVAVVKAGVFSVMKVVVYIFGIDFWERPRKQVGSRMSLREHCYSHR